MKVESRSLRYFVLIVDRPFIRSMLEMGRGFLMFVYQLPDNTLNSHRKGSTGHVQRRSGLLEWIKSKEVRPKTGIYQPLIQGLDNSSLLTLELRLNDWVYAY